MNYCQTLIFIYFASIALGTGNGSALEVERKNDEKAKFTGKVKKGGHKKLLKSQRCCKGDDVLLCVNIELDTSTITSKKDLHLEPLNTTLVFKEMIGKKEYKYENDEFELTFTKKNSKGTFGFSNYKDDGRLLLIENCKKRYVLKIVTKEDAKNVLKDQDSKAITVENCRFNGATMSFRHNYVARDDYRSTCINRCSKDLMCYAWTWDRYYGYCFLYKPTLIGDAWYKASGPDFNSGSHCDIGSKRCSTYSGITDVVYVGYTGANSASTCEAICKSLNICNYWNWYYDTCYLYATRYSPTFRYHSAEWC